MTNIEKLSTRMIWEELLGVFVSEPLALAASKASTWCQTQIKPSWFTLQQTP